MITHEDLDVETYAALVHSMHTTILGLGEWAQKLPSPECVEVLHWVAEIADSWHKLTFALADYLGVIER